MSVFKALQPLIFTFFSFPLHSGRGLGGDVVAVAVDVLHLAYDAVGHLVQQFIGQAGPCGGHEVLGLHGTQSQRQKQECLRKLFQKDILIVVSQNVI